LERDAPRRTDVYVDEVRHEVGRDDVTRVSLTREIPDVLRKQGELDAHVRGESLLQTDLEVKRALRIDPGVSKLHGPGGRIHFPVRVAIDPVEARSLEEKSSREPDHTIR